ncbi:SDR family oxidoreductase [Paenibacillus sp. YAF4_2]|uniref:SDR family oxidoreductase n=1 Tax=Paenibacillus sp. YAF4_2 TaxID=3233085 RepID=UPI003F9B576B
MIIVTGANGQLGQAVVDQLLERVSAETIGVSVRDVTKAQALIERGVRVRRGDYDDAESLADAFEGASQVLIVSSDSSGEATIRQHRTAIDAAKMAGAGRILYTSQMGSSHTSHFAPMVDHAATEEMLQDSGVPYTSLRNGFYTASGIMLLGQAIQTGILAAPADGPIAWTSHADLAELTAILLTEQPIDGVTPVLTSSEMLDLEDIAAVASELTGRPIRRVVISDEEYRDQLISYGLPEERADLLLGIFLASREGEFARTDSTLAKLIGRMPMTFRDVLKTSQSLG